MIPAATPPASLWTRVRLPVALIAFAGGCAMLSYSMILLEGHYRELRDVRESTLPLAAQIPPLERRAALLSRQTELSELEAGVRAESAEEKLRVYVLPKGDDLRRLLPFLESARTLLERRRLLSSMSPMQIGEPEDVVLPGQGPEPLQARTISFSMVIRPEGRAQFMTILELSGMITVGDALSPENLRDIFALTEGQNFASIVPIEQFLAVDLLSYLQEPRLHDERLAQALGSRPMIDGVRSILQSSRLPQVRDYLLGDLGRTIVAQKFWPVQFITIERESLSETTGGWETLDLTLKAYSRAD